MKGKAGGSFETSSHVAL